MQGIQKVVYEIIKTSRELGLPYITVATIKEEAKKTSLNELDDEFSNTKRNQTRKNKNTKLDDAIAQALRELKKKSFIKQRKRNHWTIVKGANKYKPSICKAFKEQYEIYCPKCKEYHYKTVDKKSEVKRECPKCGKKVSIGFYRFYCPVREVFVGDPTEQCELIHGTDLTRLTPEVFPMRICYFAKKPTKLSLEYAQEKVKQEDEMISNDKRFYESNTKDPLSKHYLPNLEKEE